MKFVDKEFKEYWTIIKVPTFVLILWSTVSLIIGFISFLLYMSIFSPMAGWILIIAVFSFVGWTIVKDHKEKVKIAAWAGALTSAITGFVGAIIGVFMFHLVPEVMKAAIAQAGANAAAVERFMVIGVYIGLIIGPLFSGIISAIVGLIGKTKVLNVGKRGKIIEKDF